MHSYRTRGAETCADVTSLHGAFRLTCLLTVWLITSAAAFGESPNSEAIKVFQEKIGPLLRQRCLECHGQAEQESNLRLDTYVGMLNGGASGPAVVPGNPDESLLISAISYQSDSLKMPPDRKLSDEEIELLRRWITDGAAHPEMDAARDALQRQTAAEIAEARRHWAFQPINRPQPPEVNDASWNRNPIDAFVHQHLYSHDLRPVPPCDKQTLIRRATFDLIGLPPTPEEISSFVSDDSPDAFEKVVDRLLASQHYGERWGRHWLDVARYADSNGLDENVAHIDAWRYRDYVVKAFNEDRPFNQFLVEQLAGDLLIEANPSGTRGEDGAEGVRPVTEADRELLIATGFLSLGAKVLAEKDPVKMQMDIIDEQISTLGQAVLGLTLGCARCHDHKFDPIATADYYALAGIFKSTHTMESLKVTAKWNEHFIADQHQVTAKRHSDERLEAKRTEILAVVEAAKADLTPEQVELVKEKGDKSAEDQFSDATKARLKELRSELKVLKSQAPTLPTAMGVQEGEITDVRIHVRGSHLSLGKTIPRGIPAVVALEGPLDISPSESGRIQLARWIVDRRNPLTARVAVNRIWNWYFGHAIVPSVDNFGLQGEPPINPDLLDWLAAEFMDTGWSIKSLHKQIMLSNTYRMSSQHDSNNAAIDPDNTHQWRANVRRLEAEAIRDALLAVSGRLDTKMGGSMLRIPRWGHIFNHRSKDNTSYDSDRRSVYLPVVRNNLYDVFSLFDYTAADVPCGTRVRSTVAPQALFMMNSDLILECSAALAQRILSEESDDNSRVERLYDLTVGRKPMPQEASRFLDYVSRFRQMLESTAENDRDTLAWNAACQMILASNEFVYVQ